MLLLYGIYDVAHLDSGQVRHVLPRLSFVFTIRFYAHTRTYVGCKEYKQAYE